MSEGDLQALKKLNLALNQVLNNTIVYKQELQVFDSTLTTTVSLLNQWERLFGQVQTELKGEKTEKISANVEKSDTTQKRPVRTARK